MINIHTRTGKKGRQVIELLEEEKKLFLKKNALINFIFKSLKYLNIFLKQGQLG